MNNLLGSAVRITHPGLLTTEAEASFRSSIIARYYCSRFRDRVIVADSSGNREANDSRARQWRAAILR